MGVVSGLVLATGSLTALAHEPATSRDSPFNCVDLACGIPAHGSYPHLVLGRVTAIADRNQARGLFSLVRKSGRWAALPDSPDAFWENLQPVAIEAAKGVRMTVLTSRDEMRAAPLQVGDFVRYSPHRGRYEIAPTDPVAKSYWAVDGCVAVLCRADDVKCASRYIRGLFRAEDGVELSPRTLKPQRAGLVIDTESLLPRMPAGRK